MAYWYATVLALIREFKSNRSTYLSFFVHVRERLFILIQSKFLKDRYEIRESETEAMISWALFDMTEQR